MSGIVLKGRCAIPGRAEGYAVVYPDGIAGNSGVLGDVDGVIHEKSNVNFGASIEDKILVVPYAKGSIGFSAHFRGAFIAGVRPAGWVVTKVDARLGVTLASMNIPAVVDFTDPDPVNVIATGDYVTINADSGTVTVMRRGGREEE